MWLMKGVQGEAQQAHRSSGSQLGGENKCSVGRKRKGRAMMRGKDG